MFSSRLLIPASSCVSYVETRVFPASLSCAMLSVRFPAAPPPSAPASVFDSISANPSDTADNPPDTFANPASMSLPVPVAASIPLEAFCAVPT